VEGRRSASRSEIDARFQSLLHRQPVCALCCAILDEGVRRLLHSAGVIGGSATGGISAAPRRSRRIHHLTEHREHLVQLLVAEAL
jgi:hypothetical protein